MRRKPWSGLLAAVLVGAVIPAGSGPGAAAAPPAGGTAPTDNAPTDSAPTDSAPADSARHLVLITGDRVTLTSTGAVSIAPGADRDGVTFGTYRDADGHVHVVPSDAESLVAAGRLDRNLFDVTELAGYGYDSTRGGTPLIVKYGRNDSSAARGRFAKGGARLGRDLPSVGGAAVEAPAATAGSFWNEITTGTGRRELRGEIGGVWLDRKLSLNLDTSVPQVGAPTAWAAGYDGTGTKVAVLDTGIDDTHPDLTGKVLAAKNFTAEADPRDLLGHGTHVASIVAGTGAASGGTHRGVAPGASLLSGKVCFVAQSDNCPESAILAGMQWAVDQGADVVNLSLGGADTVGLDPMEEAVNTLSARHDTLFVVSAGNNGDGEMTVESPSTADAALSVGAVRDDDTLTGFSARGPRLGDTAMKPELTAPGQGITAAASTAAGTVPPGEFYVQYDGTSMAAPHVAGAAAILAQRHPGWTGEQVKSALLGSARPHEATPVFGQGAGRLDIGRGYDQTVLADPPSLSLGRQHHPHADDPVLERTVTYTNTGASARTLDLTVTARGPDGATAPAGMFTLDTPSVTVPAGGSATVRFTAVTAIDGAEGHYGGTVTATAEGDVRVVTPFAVDRAIAGGEVTLHHLTSTGRPATSRSTILFSLDGGEDYYLGNESEPMTRFIRAGTYFLQSRISDDPDDPNSRETLLVNPSVRIEGDRSITLDARTARSIDVDVTDDPAERPHSVELGYSWQDDAGRTRTYSNLFDATNPFAFGQVEPGRRTAGLSSYLNLTLAQPGPGPGSRNSPRSYHLLERFEKYVPTGFTRDYLTTTLARVDARLAESAPDTEARKSSYPYFGDQWAAGQFELRFDLPFTHTEYYSTGGKQQWFSAFGDFQPASRASTIAVESAPRTYTPGRAITEGWNEPVIGPSYAGLRLPTDGVQRVGNTLHLEPRLVGDGSGHSGWGNGSPQFTLRRNGTAIADSTEGPWPDVPVRPGAATYELAGTVEQSAPAELSTRISAVWTFRSSRPSGGASVPVPLWTASFRPVLDAGNVARAGTTVSFPVTLAAQRGSEPGRVRTVAVEYSTDDGASWRGATVSGSGTARTVSVTHPEQTGFVSLRATVTDAAGNSVRQTVLRAYRIAP
ncbi:S8 family serine peptidase [Jidongwangia harbinensis]|uniref:S8 family serine peptidase n=1 Tax=Jidongwangia harbinensis TaxID=2878561 RepID=UPI001CD9DD19|nr:S8 family serine peptidase [Jidongwangia harbinensis]MCA2215907.1 S8 family serine peptidase [Jidongwangia harbinensis]